MFFKTIKGKPTPIDTHIGKRIKLRRSLMGMSQKTMAEELGITFQQIQKYETAKNRVAASRLYHIACILKVPFDYFIMDFEKGKQS